ncbi:hypothetical protein KUCAC02_001114, partial [Chaenocephalus aceratus]
LFDPVCWYDLAHLAPCPCCPPLHEEGRKGGEWERKGDQGRVVTLHLQHLGPVWRQLIAMRG